MDTVAINAGRFGVIPVRCPAFCAIVAFKLVEGMEEMRNGSLCVVFGTKTRAEDSTFATKVRVKTELAVPPERTALPTFHQAGYNTGGVESDYEVLYFRENTNHVLVPQWDMSTKGVGGNSPAGAQILLHDLFGVDLAAKRAATKESQKVKARAAQKASA